MHLVSLILPMLNTDHSNAIQCSLNPFTKAAFLQEATLHYELYGVVGLLLDSGRAI